VRPACGLEHVSMCDGFLRKPLLPERERSFLLSSIGGEDRGEEEIKSFPGEAKPSLRRTSYSRRKTFLKRISSLSGGEAVVRR